MQLGEKSTQERILDVAENRFISAGIEKTQMTDIAVGLRHQPPDALPLFSDKGLAGV